MVAEICLGQWGNANKEDEEATIFDGQELVVVTMNFAGIGV